jgi:hypothetical protein
MEKIYKFPFRETKMGAITKTIVICPTCRKILKPTKEYRSRTGRHGEDIYVHEHQVYAVFLEQSNSGKRRIDMSNELQNIKDFLEMAWLYGSEDEVYTVIKAYLVSLKAKGDENAIQQK